MLKLIFVPATKLMDRLSYSYKFFILGFLFISIVSILSYNLIDHLQQTIELTKKQLTGLSHQQMMFDVIREMQKHRTYSTLRLDDIPNNAAKIDLLFEQVSSQLPTEFLTQSDWQNIEKRWQYLRQTDVTMGLNNHYDSHTKIIAKLIYLQQQVADHFSLSIFEEISSNNLLNATLTDLMPIIEISNELKDQTLGVLTKKQATSDQLFEINLLTASLKTKLRDLRIHLNTTLKNAPELETTLHKVIDDINASSRALIHEVNQNINNANGVHSTIAFYQRTESLIDDSYHHLNHSMFKLLNDATLRNLGQAKTALSLGIGITLFFVLLVIYFSVGIYLSSVKTIFQLKRTAQSIASGDLETRIEVTTEDELRQVALSFNYMADQISNLLRSERRTLEVLSEQQATLEAFFENMDSAVVIFKVNDQPLSLTTIAVNQATERLENANRSKLIAEDINVLFPNALENGFYRAIMHVWTTGEATHFPIINHDKYQQIAQWREHYIYKLPNQHIVVIYQDITDKKQNEEALNVASLIYDNSNEAMMVSDSNNKIIAINPAYTAITGYQESETLGQNPSLLKSGKHDNHFYHEMWQSLLNNGHWQGEIWNKKKSGENYLEWLSISTIKDTHGDIYRYVALFSDITEKKRSEEIIWRQANYDSLTHLPNRRMFQDRLEQEIRKCHRNHSNLALLFLDLDNFKEVNDTLGHDAGDTLLVEASRRITDLVRESDTVARLGGDEFTIILSDLDDLLIIEAIAEKVLRSLSAPFIIKNRQTYVSASIGITLYPNDAEAATDLIKNADQAMYLAKESGRNRFAYFTQYMQDQAQKRHEMLNDLHIAVEQEQFQLHYQPIINLQTGAIYKAEALLRWNHPIKGYISPAEFIALTEESGLIQPIGDWAFKEALNLIKKLKHTYNKDIQVSVNKSPMQFKTKHDHQDWLEMMEKEDIKGQQLIIEITESLLMEDKSSIQKQLSAFRNANIEIAMDDFGTGYSSLSYLKKFDIDYLKIDQSFIKNLTPASTDFILTEAIITMAHKLGLKVVAEGIETIEQQQLLTEAGCDFGQGYYISRPIPEDDFVRLLIQTNEHVSLKSKQSDQTLAEES
jgi:diguanylate cyclase (GGDEF)-like protein/PAS domain S-box-containing protein